MGLETPKWIRRFLLPFLLAITVVIIVQTFCNNYKLIFVGNSDRCIPGYVFVVKIGAKPVTGQLAMFSSPKTELLPEGINIIKFVAATEGESVTVKESQVVTHAKTYYSSIKKAAEFLEIPKEQLLGTTTVKDEHLFMLGTFEGSYDSRFFGQINQERVIGRAYMLI